MVMNFDRIGNLGLLKLILFICLWFMIFDKDFQCSSFKLLMVEELITWSFLIVGLYFHQIFMTIYSTSLNSRLLMCMSLWYQFWSSIFANLWSLPVSGGINNCETNNACDAVDFLETNGKMSAQQIWCMLCFRKRLIRQLVIFAFYCQPCVIHIV